SEENGYALDPAEVRRVITPKTRLIVLTNLHNPSSVLVPELALLEVGELARSVGAHVLVDEVYLDAVYINTPRPSFHLGPEFIANHKSVSTPRTEFGTTAILRLVNGNVDQFLCRLRTEQETSAVPGRFFELPNHFRIGMGVDTEMFREGLKRIGKILDTTSK